MPRFRGAGCLWALVLAVPLGAVHQVSREPPLDTVAALRGNPIPNPFKNVLIVIHCRVKSAPDRDPDAICRERMPLFHGYQKYFGSMLWLTRNECMAGPYDPYKCLAKVMKEQAAQYDGLFYLHFDALLRPSRLAQTFDSQKMASFGLEDGPCKVKGDGLLASCKWGAWGAAKGNTYREAVRALLAEVPELQGSANPSVVWIGMDDLFYIPQRLYGLYGKIAKVFTKYQIHHEIAGPTMRKIMMRSKGIQDRNLSCTGSCCTQLGAEIALRSDFTCGHSFPLQDLKTQDAIKNVLSLRRSEGGLEDEDAVHGTVIDLARILDEITA